MDNPHHNGVTLMPFDSMLRMIGIIAAVNGMLSITAERNAAIHMSTKVAVSRSRSTKGVMN